jgi:hypothetical protein
VSIGGLTPEGWPDIELPSRLPSICTWEFTAANDDQTKAFIESCLGDLDVDLSGELPHQ